MQETENHLIAARDRGILPPPEWRIHSTEVVEIRRMTYALRRTVLEGDR